MSLAVVRVDPSSGYQWADFYLDAGERWVETFTWKKDGSPIDVFGYSAELLVLQPNVSTLVLDLASPADITVGDVDGSFSWDVSSEVIATLTYPLYNYELRVAPGGDPAAAKPLSRGRVLIRGL